jgi:lysozyme
VSAAAVHGLDVWEGYGPIDWDAVARSGVRFVYVRATSAEAGVDKRVRENVKGARAAGLDVGIYHVTWCGRGNPSAEATHALGLWRELREFLALPLALDFEMPATKGRSTEQLRAQAASLCSLATMIEAGTGRTPVLYSYPSYVPAFTAAGADLSPLLRCPLWIAHYKRSGLWEPDLDVDAPSLPAPWDTWAIWQYAADGSGPHAGIPAAGGVDRNVIPSAEIFDALAGRAPWPALPRAFDLGTTLGLQRALNAAGASPALKEDGIPGAKTTAAVKAFQARSGLTADGIVGPKTRAALKATT